MNNPLETFVPLRMTKRGLQQLATTDAPFFDATILQGLGRAFYWRELLQTNVVASGSEIARLEGLHHTTVNALLRLTLLAPDIVDRIMDGRQPRRLSLLWLLRTSLPMDWQKQRDLIARFE